MKYVLVTGAAGGMGKETISLLRSEGYTVFAMDCVELPQQEGVVPLKIDITDEESLKNAFAQVSEVTDSLFAIIHFAGMYVLDSLIEIPDEKFVQAFQVNVFGAYRVNRIFAPLLKTGSRIILTSSELAPLEPLPFTGLYAVTKSALDKYASSLRMELQLMGIGVAVLRPGAVNTGMLGVSTDQLTFFCENTKLYPCNAVRFRKIVDSVEAKNISAAKLARKVNHILQSRRMRPVYHINRNPLLIMLNLLPLRLQMYIIRRILK